MAGSGPLRDGNLTATVLFTDLVGSTSLRVGLGEDAADVLMAAHDQLLRHAVEAHGGLVVKGGGDGLMALFTAASEALAAAEACQQAAWAHNRDPAAPARLEIRVGLSVGDVAIRDGDCFGTPVIEAARLEAAAQGGQVLCSDLVGLMARGRGGHELRLVGPLDLKGLPEPVTTYELRWEPPTPAAAPMAQPAFPPQLAAETARPFVGRVAELARAAAIVARPAQERLAVLWIAGEPGIGKTRLAAEIADRAHRAGATVLFGRCDEDLAVPHQPFVEALRHYTAAIGDDELPASLAPYGPVLSRLLPELSRRAPDLQPPPSTTPDADRYELYEAVRVWMRELATTGPAVVVVDDVHWAVPPTLSLLRHVARSTEAAAVTVVCTARSTAPDDHAELQATRAELERRASFHHLELVGLDGASVTELVGDAGQAARLVAETAGNPLFVDALVRGGSVASLARSRVARLDPMVQELLAVAAVVGLDFDLGVVAAAGAAEPAVALDAFEAASRAGVVHETGTDHFGFTHALVRAALRDELSRSRRARLHAAVAETLEPRVEIEPAVIAEAVAHHCLEAGPIVAPARTANACARAGAAAAQQLAYAVAAQWYREALAHAEDPVSCTRWRFELGQALHRLSDFAAALMELEAACEGALGLGDVDLAHDAALLFEDGSWRPGFPGDRAVEVVDAVLDACGTAGDDGRRRAPLLAARARALTLSGRRAEASVATEEALAFDLAARAPAARAEVLVRCSYGLTVPLPTPRVGHLARELSELGDSSGDVVIQLMGASISSDLAASLGDMGTSASLRQQVTGMARRAADPFWVHIARVYDIMRAFDNGDLAAAELAIEQANRRDQGLESAWAEPDGVYGLRMFQVRREQDRLADVAPMVRLLSRRTDQQRLWRPGLALLLTELGRLDEAEELLDALAGEGFSSIADDDNRLLHVCFLAEAAAAVRSPVYASWLAKELTPVLGRNLELGGTGLCLGPGDRYVGLARACAGDIAGGRARFDAALGLARRMGSPLWQGRVLADLAVICGDGAAAEEAIALAERHGLPAIARRARGH